MKIGLSYSRCIRDIIDGKVAMRDVLVMLPAQTLILVTMSNGPEFGKATAAANTTAAYGAILNGPDTMMKQSFVKLH